MICTYNNASTGVNFTMLLRLQPIVQAYTWSSTCCKNIASNLFSEGVFVMSVLAFFTRLNR